MTRILSVEKYLQSRRQCVLSSLCADGLFSGAIQFNQLLLVLLFLLLIALDSRLIVELSQSSLFVLEFTQFPRNNLNCKRQRSYAFPCGDLVFSWSGDDPYPSLRVAFSPFCLFLIVTSVTLAASATSFCVLFSFSNTHAT